MLLKWIKIWKHVEADATEQRFPITLCQTLTKLYADIKLEKRFAFMQES